MISFRTRRKSYTFVLPSKVLAPFPYRPQWETIASHWDIQSLERLVDSQWRVILPGWELTDSCHTGENRFLNDDEGRERAEIYPSRGGKPGLIALRPRYRIQVWKEPEGGLIHAIHVILDTGVVPVEVIWDSREFKYATDYAAVRKGTEIRCTTGGLFAQTGCTAWLKLEYRRAAAFLDSEHTDKDRRRWRDPFEYWEPL